MGHFGFVIHPLRGARDVARKYPLARLLPESVLAWAITRMRAKPVGHITGIRGANGTTADGWLVGCGLLPSQFYSLPEEFVLGKIVASVELAAELGAQIVGLGAFTSVVGDGGRRVAERVKVAVTTGNSYTVATAIQGLRQAADLMGISPANATAAVVGATGSIGRICARLLSRTVPEMLLVGRDLPRLEAVAAELDSHCAVSCSTDPAVALPRADLVVTVTSAVDTVVAPEHLKRGAVVCDVARPRDVSRAVASKRPDVLVIEGGVVAIPGEVDFGFNFGFPPRTAYACMAETAILALEERYEPFSLGRELSLERVEEIARLAEKHGFRLAGFRSFERALTEEQIARTRRLAGR